MSGYLCLKWNNHTTAIQKSISKIQIKERYCDATIVCQEKYFPVHRIILSMCSGYFEEIFERMQCQHPYVVFKDIQPREMEMLLNYMYQGEVNVVQEMLPSLIQAAESLKIKGLAVPDDLPMNNDPLSRRKRSNSSDDNPQPKRRSEEGRRSRDSLDVNMQNKADEDGNLSLNKDSFSEFGSSDSQLQYESQLVKEESLQSLDCGSGAESGAAPPLPLPSSRDGDAPPPPAGFAPPGVEDGVAYLKTEAPSANQDFDKKPSGWGDMSRASMLLQSLHPSDITRENPISEMSLATEESGSSSHLPIEWDANACREEEGEFSSQATSACLNPPNPPLPYRCLYCDYRGYRTSQIKSHMRFKHTGERPFACSLCARRFVEKIGLDRHMMTHTGVKPFQCEQCLQKFSQKVNLKYHMVRKHQVHMVNQM